MAYENRIIGTGTEHPEQLLANPNNWRIHPKAQQDALESSLTDVGWVQHIIVNQRTGHVVDGHMRASVAISRNEQEVPVVYVDLSDEEENLILSTYDPIGAMAVADKQQLDELLEKVSSDSDVINDLLGSIADNYTPLHLSESGEDDSFDINKKLEEIESEDYEPTVKLGDVWKLGDHRVMCGDSTNLQHVEQLMDGKKADMVFTDPPYGVEYRSNKTKRFEQIENDDTILEIAPIIWQFLADNSAAFVWTSHHVYPIWRQQFDTYYKQTIIWAKGGSGMGDLEGQYALNYEMALFCVKGSPKFQGKRGMAVWNIGKDSASDYVHPTQKPVALAEQGLADFSKTDHIVLDLFGGSGSTLIACERQHRHARLMEIDPSYCDVTIRRWEDLTGQQAEKVFPEAEIPK